MGSIMLLCFLSLTFSGADSFTLLFLFGEVVPPEIEPPITELQFQCNDSATWSSSSDGKVPFQPKVTFSKVKKPKLIPNIIIPSIHPSIHPSIPSIDR